MKYYNYLIYTILISINIFFGTIQSNDILLIVNYNHPHYESVPLLKKVYGPFFKDIVFYGPTQHPQIIDIPHNKGFFSYLCIADAMKKFPNYDGYFFLMDDCVVLPWLTKDLDLKKIWYCSMWFYKQEKGNPINITQGKNATQWSWWNTQWGLRPTITTFNEIPSNYKRKLAENWGPSTVVCDFSDIVYIPKDYCDQFIELAELFGKHKVFLEIALPTIMCCISDKNDWLWLLGNGTYGDSIKLFDKNVPINHPLKLSSKENRNFIETFFNSKVS